MDIIIHVNIQDNEYQLRKHIQYLIFHDYIFLLIHKLFIHFFIISNLHYYKTI